MKQVKWTQEQLSAARALAVGLAGEARTDLTVEQNMKNALASRLEGVDADHIVSDLCDGIDAFHQAYEKAQDEGLEALVNASLDGHLSGKTEDEQADWLYSVLTACAQAVDQPIPERQAGVTAGQLRGMVVEYFTDYALLHIDCGATEFLVSELDGADRLADAEDWAFSERYMALALYLLKSAGDLKGVPAQMGAKEIGASAAAAMCESRVVRDGLLGRIDWEDVKRKLKLIAGAVLTAVILIVAARLAATAFIVTGVLVEAIVGMGVIGSAAGFLLGIAAAVKIISKGGDIAAAAAIVTGFGEVVREKTGRLSDWYHETFLPAAKNFWQRVRAALSGLAGHRAAAQETEAETTAQTVRSEDAQFASA